MPATDEELVKRTQEIERLRQKVMDEESKRDTILRESHNDLVLATLDNEESRLNERLEAAKDATKAARQSVKESVRAAKHGSTTGPESDTTDNPSPDGEAVTPTGEAPKNNKE